MTTIDTPEGIRWFQFLQVYHGVKLQATTGMTHSRGSLINLSKQRYGTTSRTAKGTLKQLQVIKDDAEAQMYGDSDDAR